MLKNRTRKHQAGFTIFELLIVMLLLTTVGTVIVSIFFLSLRSSNKAASLTNVRQNGNYVISQMGKDIRFAQTLNAPDPCNGDTTTITVTSLDGDVITYAYDSGDATITQNGASVFNTGQLEVPSATFTCVQQDPADPPFLTITFQLRKRGTGNLADQTATINFTTTIALRNWQR